MSHSKARTARDIMQRRLHTIRPDEQIEKAVRLLLKKGHSGAPVVDAEGQLCGVLSEHDCIQVLASAVVSGWPGGPVSDHMTQPVDAAGPDDDLLSLARHFAEAQHRRLIVVEDGRLLGLVSRGDLLRALDHLEKMLARAGRSRSTYDIIEQHRSD